jgi:hypothetical protein
MKEENYNYLSFLKIESWMKYSDLLPPGFPKISEYEAIGSEEPMDPEIYLKHCDVRTLLDSSIKSEDIVYNLLEDMESRETNIRKNTLINCLSYPKTDEERFKKLRRFGAVLKELGYIEPTFNEKIGRDEYGRPIQTVLNRKSGENTDLQELAILLKRIITS